MKNEPHRYTHRYRVVTMDVWGNSVDGWEVNNWFRHGASLLKVFSKSSDGPSEAEVLLALREAGLIKKNIKSSSIGVEWNDNGWSVVDNRTPKGKVDYGFGKPEYELELDNED